MATEFFNRVSENLISLGKRLKVSTPPLAGKAPVVDEIVANINSPMLIMVMGEFSTGKSTFINALVKRDIATVGAQPTTAVITKLSYGIDYVSRTLPIEILKKYDVRRQSRLKRNFKGVDVLKILLTLPAPKGGGFLRLH